MGQFRQLAAMLNLFQQYFSLIAQTTSQCSHNNNCNSIFSYANNNYADAGLDMIDFSYSDNSNPFINNGSLLSAENLTLNNGDNNDEAARIWNSIDPAERKLVEGKDLSEIDKITGKPMYTVAKGSSDHKYHIYDKYGKCVKDVEYGNNHLYGCYDKNDYQKMGGNSSHLKYDAIKEGYVETEDGYDYIADVLSIDIKNDKPGFYLAKKGETLSPLVVDYNQDGKVSAEAGKGVDIDGDGKADGAATGGDKMLAMSDSNGNGSIDGTEVFGNKTVNPFTGKAINAKNGFEALKEVAKSAQNATGINCFDGKNVDLNALKQALSTKGINLGFVSDDNNKQIEELSKINKINVTDYKNTQESGKVQHNQQGSGTSSNGSTMKVDDVWFEKA